MSFERETFPFDLLPGVIDYYLSKYRTATECPDEFLAGGALAIASTLAGPHYTVCGGNKLNDYYLFVGSTGRDKKTTAISAAVDLYHSCLSDLGHLTHIVREEDKPDKTFKPYDLVTKFSTEGIMERGLATGGSTLVTINEYAYVFQLNKRQNQGNTVSDLTDLYDGKPIAKRTVEKSIAVSNFTMSILASSTREWIKELGSAHHVAGGFVNRHINYVGSPERIISLSRTVSAAELTPVIETFRKLVPEGLRAVQEGNSVRWEGPGAIEIPLESKAQHLWDLYYKSEKKAYREVQSDRLVEIGAREQLHALKQAALRALLDQRREINPQDLVYGARLARWSTRNAIELLGIQELFDFGVYNKPAKKILRYLQVEEPQSKDEIAQRHGGKQAPVNAALGLLIGGKFVRQDNDQYFLGERFQAQDSDIEEYFGKSSICALLEKLNLEATPAAGKSDGQ